MRGANDEQLRFVVPNPGRNSHEHVGVVWRKKSDGSQVALAAEIPPDPTPPPPPHNPKPHMGCDPVAGPVNLGAPINQERAVHISFESTSWTPGIVTFQSWLDPTIKGTVVGKPKMTADFGDLQFVYSNPGGGGTPAMGYWRFDPRCTDGALLPRRVKVRVEFKVKAGGKVRAFSGSVELELAPDATIRVAPPKSTSVEALPLSRRYAGTIEKTERGLRAVPPAGVTVLEERWYRDGESTVCVMRVADGLCIASWPVRV